jgi:hypothetical protein
MPIGVPGCPELAFSTASMARPLMVLTASCSIDPLSVIEAEGTRRSRVPNLRTQGSTRRYTRSRTLGSLLGAGQTSGAWVRNTKVSPCSVFWTSITESERGSASSESTYTSVPACSAT